MMKEGHWPTKLLYTCFTWGVFNHAFHAPQVRACNYYVYVLYCQCNIIKYGGMWRVYKSIAFSRNFAHAFTMDTRISLPPLPPSHPQPPPPPCAKLENLSTRLLYDPVIHQQVTSHCHSAKTAGASVPQDDAVIRPVLVSVTLWPSPKT